MSKRAFISYKREDRELAKKLAEAFQQDGISVFWDADIEGGAPWRAVLERELSESACVVVLWSKAAQTSDWVIGEANRAKEDRKLLPVFVEPNLRPLLGFDEVQHRPLFSWTGDRSDPQYQALLVDVARRMDAPVPTLMPARPPQAFAGVGRWMAVGLTVLTVAVTAWVVITSWGAGQDAKRERVVPADRVRFAAGTFTMGSTGDERQAALAACRRGSPEPDRECRADLYEREGPTREVTLSAYALHKNEVTHQEVADRFAAWSDVRVATRDSEPVLEAKGEALLYLQNAVGLQLDGQGPGLTVRAGWARKPATGMTWAGARRYCREVGGDLPTEAQWERAARGLEGRRFPWGSKEPTCDDAVFGRDDGLPCAGRPAEPKSVDDAATDQTPERVKHLGGNVGEWVLDGFRSTYPACSAPCQDPVVEAPDAQNRRVVRGGWFNLLQDGLRGASRSRFSADSSDISIGFRCAFSIE